MKNPFFLSRHHVHPCESDVHQVRCAPKSDVYPSLMCIQAPCPSKFNIHLSPMSSEYVLAGAPSPLAVVDPLWFGLHHNNTNVVFSPSPHKFVLTRTVASLNVLPVHEGGLTMFGRSPSPHAGCTCPTRLFLFATVLVFCVDQWWVQATRSRLKV